MGKGLSMNKKQELQSVCSEKIRLQQSINILSATLGSLVSGIAGFAGQKYKNNYKSAIHKKNRSYPFIPYPPHSVVDQLYVAFRKLGSVWGKYRFLDAGCGIGNIMLLAEQFGFIVHGLEIDPTLLATANKINKFMFSKMEKQNIMTYKRYGEYDVIYYYCPYSSSIKEERFEECVENEMKVGAIVIPNYKISIKIKKDKRFKHIPVIPDGNPIYIKIKA